MECTTFGSGGGGNVTAGPALKVVAMADDSGANAATFTPIQFKSWVTRTNGFLSRAGIHFTFSVTTPSPDWTKWKNAAVNALSRDNQDGVGIAQGNTMADGTENAACVCRCCQSERQRNLPIEIAPSVPLWCIRSVRPRQ